MEFIYPSVGVYFTASGETLILGINRGQANSPDLIQIW